MTPLRPAQHGIWATLLALALAAAGAAQPPQRERPRRLLLDQDGRAQVVTLRSISDREIVFEDALGRLRRMAVGGAAALAPAQLAQPLLAVAPSADRQEQPAAAPSLRTVDGQRLPGRLAGTAEGEESVVWAHDAFGAVVVPLERVAQAVLRAVEPGAAVAAIPPPQQGGDDELLLVNGDRLSGFLRSLGDPVQLETDDGAVVEIPPDRVAVAQLANPPEPRQGLVVWLEDGSIVVVASLAPVEEGDVELTLPTGQSAVYPLASIQAVAFEAGSLRALASIEPALQKGPADRLWTPPLRRLGSADQPLDLIDLVFPGPMRVEWPLPDNARRFVAVAELPVEVRDWGDCEIVVRVDGVEKLRRRLSGDEPKVEINIPARGSTLSIEIEEGRYGPIRDEVVLRRPALLLEKTP